MAPAGAWLPAPWPEFAAAAARTAPAGREVLRFRWRSEDGRLALAGSGAARLAPPDSLRVDLAASLGVGRSVVVLTGHDVQASPAEVVAQIVPERFALWSVMGVLQPPDRGRLERLSDGGRTFWRVSDGARVTTFELHGDTLHAVSREENGRLAQQLRLTRERDGRVRTARLDDYARGARLEVEMTAREASGAFPEDLWRLRP